MTNIVYLHQHHEPVAHFLRVGTSSHRLLEQLLLAGRLPLRRLVVEAGAFTRQADLISTLLLRHSGREIVLDTNVAELSMVGRFQGCAKGAPWANPDGVLTPAHFRAGENQFDVVGKIARFAVEHRIHRVLAPVHFISGVKDQWFAIDRSSCLALRRSLDVQGGREIAIDYPLMISNAVLNDGAERNALISALASLPVDSIWLRTSGFGANATAAGLRKYVTAMRDFHVLDKPIISDGIGGMSALAVAAFGAASGVAHGVAEKERFDASSWSKSPDPDREGGGNSYVMLLPGVDRLIKKAHAHILMNAPGGRRLCSCHHRDCCPNGFEDTIKDPKGHYLRQRAREIDALSAVPEQLRIQHFLDVVLASAGRTARAAAKLKVDRSIAEMLQKNADRLDRLSGVLDDLHKTDGSATRAVGLPFRSELQETTKHDRH